MGYRTIAQAVTASFIEKKSEFIATLVPVQTADAAIACIEEVRKANRKARHNVYAYILRENHMTRYSDDGEPQGTAGVPVLNVLQKQNLTDVCCVVTRYFGGILLGGGMVHNQDLVKQITDACSFIAPVTAYPGEFEMEAMAAGAIRVMEGEEELKTYTGTPVWDGFDWE